jgi:23S rRNA pseudouridine2605 synthase
VASRRRAETLLREGRVRVNGRVARLGQSADPHRDRIEVDGRTLGPPRHRYWMVHKSRGLVTTRRDPQGRPTVMDLLPESVRGEVAPVGRLDRDTEGLLLLTNDGDTAHALLHPSHGSEREYRVTVRGRLTPETAARLAHGVMLGGRRTAPCRVGPRRYRTDADRTRFQLVLVEGRKRQIRRSLALLGHPVTGLVRVRFGPLALGDLPPGAARELTQAERASLRRHARRLAASARPPAARRKGLQAPVGSAVPARRPP